MPRKPPDFNGGFGYGPWPDNDVPFVEKPGGDHYRDGYADRSPGGTRYENPTDYWIDCMVYPDRPSPLTDEDAFRLDARSRALRISVGQATGHQNGPSED